MLSARRTSKQISKSYRQFRGERIDRRIMTKESNFSNHHGYFQAASRAPNNIDLDENGTKIAQVNFPPRSCSLFQIGNE